jgi:DNA primase
LYNRGNFKREADSAKYSSGQISAVLRECGVDVDAETTNDFLAFCPFHGNNHTPSFNVSKTSGVFICFNPSCNRTGTIIELIKFKTGRNEFAARRLLIKMEGAQGIDFTQHLLESMEEKPPMREFPQSKLDEAYDAFWRYPKAIDYMMNERGFTEETLRYFRIGYSYNKRILKDMIIVPMHDMLGMPIGLIGRCIDEKLFKNSIGLPKRDTLWNLHRAKSASDAVIVCEASFDAMRIHQAGYPNVVAILGGNATPVHFKLFDRYFNKIIIMTDYDEKQYYKQCIKCAKNGANLCLGHNPGRDLGHTLEDNLSHKRIMWASNKFGEIYPDGKKDAGQLTDDEIRQCIKNAVTSYEYRTWSLY